MTFNYTDLHPGRAGESDHKMPTMAELHEQAKKENEANRDGLAPGFHYVFVKDVKLYIAKTGTEFMIVVFQNAKKIQHSEFMTLTFKPFPIMRISELWAACNKENVPSPEPWNDTKQHRAALQNEYLGIEIKVGKKPTGEERNEIDKFVKLTDEQLDKLADEFEAELIGSGHAGEGDDIPF